MSSSSKAQIFSNTETAIELAKDGKIQELKSFVLAFPDVINSTNKVFSPSWNKIKVLTEF